MTIGEVYSSAHYVCTQQHAQHLIINKMLAKAFMMQYKCMEYIHNHAVVCVNYRRCVTIEDEAHFPLTMFIRLVPKSLVKNCWRDGTTKLSGQ